MNLVKNAELSPNNRRKRSSQSSKLAFKKTLKLGTALGAIAWLGYGRGAYAADTFNSSNISTVYITGPDQVVTGSGFSVDTTVEDGIGDSAISIRTSGGDVSFTHSYNGKIVGKTGIDAQRTNPGDIIITTVGEVTGTNGNGIFVSGYTAGDTQIDAQDVYGATSGVSASSLIGDIKITADSVYGETLFGISSATNSSTDEASVLVTTTGTVEGDLIGIRTKVERGQINVNAHDVSGGTGIYAHTGNIENHDYDVQSSSISITSTGTVNGTEDYGVYAYTIEGDITITAHDVTSVKGVKSVVYYAGESNITISGTVISTNGKGIDAYGYHGSVIINANQVNGTNFGINAYSFYEEVNINTLGSVNASDPDGVGIYAYGWTGATVNANDVAGGLLGINALSYNGTVTITTTGNVSGTNGTAIVASGANDVVINANEVSGGSAGISAESFDETENSGNVTIIAGGSVSGANGKGINAVTSVAFNAGNAGNVSITANDVSGTFIGVRAAAISNISTGSAGDINVNVNYVNSQDFSGISANSQGLETGNITITTNDDVLGGDIGGWGIDAFSLGFLQSGHVTITTHDIEGESGIFASNQANYAGDVSVTADNVIGRSGQGIRAESFGASSGGSVTITVNDVTGTGNDGIVARSVGTDSAAGNVTIRANDVTGYENGIDAESRSADGIAGNVTITANNVTGTGERGISAVSHGGEYSIDSTGNVTITANNVSGGDIGIYGTSISGDATSGDVTITANNVSGGDIGIGAYTQDGTVSVTASGTVSGPRHAMSLFGGTVELNLNEGSVIIGEVQISSKDTTNSTLNFGEGLTAVVQFDDADGEMPNTVTSPDGNHVVDGNLVYVVDGASLGAAQASRQQMNTATNGLFQSALNNRAGLTTPNGTNVRISSRGSGSTSTTWGTLIGSGVNQPATDNIAAYSGSATALIMGVDYDAQSGVFGGLSTGQVSSDDGAGFKTKQRGIYAGVYRDLGNGSKLSFSLGATETNSKRNVSGLSGLEIAKADYNSVVVNASYTKSDIFDDLDLRLSYTGTFAEGYTETASSGNLTVDDGSTHTLGVRVQKSIPMDQGGFRFGADVLRTIGQGGGITLAGQTLDVESLDTGITSRAFLGLDMDNVIAEIGVDNNGRTDATMSVKFRF